MRVFFMCLFMLYPSLLLADTGLPVAMGSSSSNILFNDLLANGIAPDQTKELSNPIEFELDGNKLKGYAYELQPTFGTSKVVITTKLMTSNLSGAQIFLIDKDHRIILDKTLSDGNFEIFVPSNARFLLISSSPNENQTFPIDLNGTISLVSTSQKLNPAHSGLIWSLGASFGGDKVTPNPNGDNYNAGAGAYVTIGYQHNLNENYPAWVGKASLGYRYQGGDGTNEGIVGHVVAGYSWTDYFLGGGIYMDAMNSVESANGTIIEFDDALGAQIVGQWRYNDQALLGVRYVIIDYGNKITSYDGNQILVEVAFEIK